MIPDTAKVSRAYQIVQRISETGEFIWGDHVDGDALGAALRSDPYYAPIYNNSVNLLFDYLMNASNEEKQRFGEFSKPYFKDGVPVKDGDDYYGAKTIGYVIYAFDNFSYKPETGMLIEQTQNNSAGNVVFSPIILYNPGTYYYRIREIVPEDADKNIIYDAEPRILKVEIKKENDAFVKTYTILNEDLSEPAELTFINQYKQYILPATGGPGILPYLFVGTGFIALSFILLLSRRRKEVSDRP